MPKITSMFWVYKRNRYSLRFYCALVLLFATLKHLFTIYSQNRISYSDPKSIKGVYGCGKETCCPSSKPLEITHNLVNNPPSYTDILLNNNHICGGGWRPENCRSVQNVSVLIPYRNRESDLRVLLSRLHPLLRHQNIAYNIILIEQTGELPFNRGLLFDLGVLYSLKINPSTDCFIFHDVDLLPENSDNLYLCDENLRQLSSAIDDFRYHPPYPNYAGGVTALSKTNVFKINGFPTRYWGWGSEDDELSARSIAYNLNLTRPPCKIGRYKSSRHVKSSLSIGHQDEFRRFRNFLHDGLTTVQNSLLNNDHNVFVSKMTSTHPIASGFGSAYSTPNPVLFVPSNLNRCVLKQLKLILPMNQSVVLNDQREQWNKTFMEQFALTQLATHLIVDPIRSVELSIGLTAKMERESLFWFLRFYGWI